MTLEQRLILTRAAVQTGNLDLSVQAIESSKEDLINKFLSATGLVVSDDHIRIATAYMEWFEWSGIHLETAINLYLDEKESQDDKAAPKTPTYGYIDGIETAVNLYPTDKQESFDEAAAPKTHKTCTERMFRRRSIWTAKKMFKFKSVDKKQDEFHDGDDQQRQRIDTEGRCLFHPEIQLIQKSGMGWKVLLYSCPRCDLDNALDGVGVQWVGQAKLPPDGTELIRNKPAAQGIINASKTSSLSGESSNLDMYEFHFAEESVDVSLKPSRPTAESRERKQPPPVRPSSGWFALGYPLDQATAMESLQSDLTRNYARRDVWDVVLRPLDEKGEEIAHLARVPYHSDMLPHWKYLMKSINEDSGIDGVEIYRVTLPGEGIETLLSCFNRAGIRRLILSHCGVPNYDVKHLVDVERLVRFIKNNVTLEEFGMAESSCLFDEQTSHDLKASIRAHPKLRRVYLASDSRISPSMLHRIVDACSEMDLVALSFPESDIDHIGTLFKAEWSASRDIRLLSVPLGGREALFISLGDRGEGGSGDGENDLPEFNKSFERSVKQMERLVYARCWADFLTTLH